MPDFPKNKDLIKFRALKTRNVVIASVYGISALLRIYLFTIRSAT